MASSIGWEFYRTFLAVLTEGSLSGAARALGITQPTVGRHVSALEASFNQTLFTRSQTGLLPTEAALALRGYVEAMQGTAAALERTATSHGQGVTGTVRISASEVIGAEVLPPMLAQLRQVHPQLKIELVLSNRVQDLLQREADIAVRMTPPQQGLLIARRVGEVALGLYARADYLQQHGTPATPADLKRHALIGFDEETPFLRAASKLQPSWTRDVFSLRTDSDLGQLALIRAGCGVGFCQSALARRDARLMRVLPEHFTFKLETWVTMHEDLRGSPRCKATFDALVVCLQAHTATAVEP
ncbi:LysR family transcriptional regulator [Pararobbsia alpina]|uniref:HTH-type transcriptional regulator HdfR n=1 Tax=Pararobbsia alpina TaxID=621374 RepID=A0A6S7BRI3_9BURK|nr:LysR family transcriptional regulator [Pararobbsia alpina]CAB3800109.1 HTH-type transcriptional regulator HdfR [Pararobbsia alpina]